MLTTRMHGLFDYFVVLIFALAPSLLPLSFYGTVVAYTLALVHLLMTLLTGYPAGVIRLIPLQLHGYVELTAGLVLAVGPWVAGNLINPTDQLFFSVAGVVILAVWLITPFRSPLHD